MFLLASPDPTGPTFTRRGVDGQAGPRLLQCHTCLGIQVHYRHAPASYECRRSHHQRRLEVRPSTARQTALSGRSTVGAVQECSTVHRCLQHKASQYMMDCCIHTSDIARRQDLRTASSRQLFVPQHRRSMFGRRAFSVAGLAAWNSLPDYLQDPTRSFDSFRSDLKTFLFSLY